MNLDLAGLAVVKAVEAIGGERISGSAVVAGAKVLFGDNGVSKLWAAYEGGDYSAMIDIGIVETAKIIAAVDPALKPIAPLAASIIVWARHHPADTLSLAMQAADGHGGGEPGTDHMSI